MGPAERADVIVDFAAFAGKTLILYNDAPAPVPAFDSRIDYYTGDPDQTLTGGAPTTMPGYGPNTRTIMQLKVGTTVTTPAPFSLATLQTELPKSFKTLFAPGTKDSLIVPESAYNAAYGATYPDTYSRIQNTQLTFTPIGSAAGPVTMDMQPKAIQELFTIDYGRMNATLGVELPFTNFTNQTTILLGYIDPPTEVLNDGETQIWKVTHNGVDSHAMHFHLFNVQILNRVGWDGAIRPPDANELGWKETVRMNPLEDAIVALRPIHMTFPFGIDESNRLLDVTRPALSTGNQFANIDPLTNNPITTVNQPTNFGWEYVWHCHLLGHEENDMMRPIVFKVQPMAVAKNVKATATATPLKVTVTWTFTNNPLPADQATGLRIYKTVGTTSNLVATILNLATTSFVDTSVAYSTTYSYRIVAFSATGASLPSNIATVTTPAAPPVALTAPTLTAPAAAVTTNTVTLVWNTITGATKYQVWRAGATGAFSLVATPLAPGITYRVTGLTTLTTYRFYVVAANGNPAANSAPSNTVTVKTK
jgi:FtsP/CotA-like multicopper oxidase with cupredoxin domain